MYQRNKVCFDSLQYECDLKSNLNADFIHRTKFAMDGLIAITAKMKWDVVAPKTSSSAAHYKVHQTGNS